MDIQAFERLLGPCMDIMKRNIANYEEQLVTLFGSSIDIEEQNAWDLEWGPLQWTMNWLETNLIWMFPPPLYHLNKHIFLQEIWKSDTHMSVLDR